MIRNVSREVERLRKDINPDLEIIADTFAENGQKAALLQEKIRKIKGEIDPASDSSLYYKTA